MKIIETELPGAVILEPQVFGDERGFFMETFHAAKFAQLGLPTVFPQDNHSFSRRGILRGLHYQLRRPQGKLVRVTRGEVFDVAVDIRRGSPAFGRWSAVVLSEDNKRMFYVPPGFAHGFCVLSDSADFLYKCTDVYTPGDEYGIRWDDPDLAISWPDPGGYTLSDKDRDAPRLRDAGDHLPRFSA